MPASPRMKSGTEGDKKKMTLTELGKQYIEQSDFIYEQIRELRPRLKTLKGFELMDLQRQLKMMYDMALDAKIIGSDLMDYYANQANISA